MSTFEKQSDKEKGIKSIPKLDEVKKTEKGFDGSKLSRADFMLGCTLGQGSYAQVVHARMKPKVQGNETTQLQYAVKIMDKEFIKKEGKVKAVMMEKKVLQTIHHDFIVKCHFAFADHVNLYIFMDLAPGGDLLGVINRCRDENEAKGIQGIACNSIVTEFYIAEIIEGLEYLHSKNIIHRDLKPDNIIITATGHIKIADFGTAYNSNDSLGPVGRFVGTAEYVTPELLHDGDDDEEIMMKLYNTNEIDSEHPTHNIDEEDSVDDDTNFVVTKACDLWAVGCMIFQMLHGKTPFRAPTEFLIFENIKGHVKGTKPINYPASVTGAARQLTESLLRKNPNERLGAGDDSDVEYSYKALKSHEFFKNTVFDGTLVNTKSPYQPDPSKFPKTNRMFDGASDEWEIEGESLLLDGIGDVQNMYNESGGPWSEFLEEGEYKVFTGLILKRDPNNFFSWRSRQLILTNQPRLVYIDIVENKLKGLVPWTLEQPVSCTLINKTSFDIYSPIENRSYHFKDASDVGADTWISYINEMLEKQKKEK